MYEARLRARFLKMCEKRRIFEIFAFEVAHIHYKHVRTKTKVTILKSITIYDFITTLDRQ